jgi:sugar lactone lactonase YvrE
MRKPLSGTIFLALILLSVVILGTGCSKTPTSPAGISAPLVVTLNLVSNVTQTTAQSGGVITLGGNADITANGVCYSSTNQAPTIADSKTIDTINTAGFTSRITGLTLGTTYYLRAYATNSGGTGYGAVVKFTTATTAATLTTTVSTIAGNANLGFLDGAGATALFNGPQSLSYNPVTGNIYIIDALNNAIRIMTPTGTVSTLTNPQLGYANGPLATALFYGPRSVAFDTQGNAYVADLGNNVIRKITPAGIVSTFAGNGTAGYADGTTPSIIEFNSPQGVAVDATGNVYVADRGNNLIRKITPTGVVSTIAGRVAPVGFAQSTAPGFADGVGDISIFNSPNALACDAAGNIYVADQGNTAIRMVTPAGAVTTIAGSPVQKTVVGAVTAIAVDAAGNIYAADQSGRIMEITANSKTLYTLAGAINNAGYIDGVGTVARFSNPQGVAVDAQGIVYVGDFNNNVIRKIIVKTQ